ncbi:hypothetical protein ScPMuIL_011641 [Solemya velum]
MIKRISLQNVNVKNVPKKRDGPPDSSMDLEQQFILRLPPGPAIALKRDVQSGSMTLRDRLSIELNSDYRHGTVRYGSQVFNAKLMDLPTIAESLKTVDKKTFYKTADICQMLVCATDEENGCEENESPKKKERNKYQFNHGITPSLKNVKRRRFRKQLKKKYMEQPDIEREITRTDTVTSLDNIDALFGEMSSSEEEEEKDVNIMDSEGEEASQDMGNSHQMSFSLDMESQDMDNDQSDLQGRLSELKNQVEELRARRRSQEQRLSDADNPSLKVEYEAMMEEIDQELSRKESEHDMPQNTVMSPQHGNSVKIWKKTLKKRSHITGKIFNVMHNLYRSSKSCVRNGDEMSEFFNSNIGVKQGENLSPFLFALFLNDLEDFLSDNNVNDLKDMSRLSREHIGMYLKLLLLLYADDTIIFAETAKELQHALDVFQSYCNLWKLTVNLDKTQVLVFAKRKRKEKFKFLLYQRELEITDTYPYLGILFNCNGKYNKTQTKLVDQAQKALFSIYTKIKNVSLSIDVQFKLFDALVSPILLYSSEVWGYENANDWDIHHTPNHWSNEHSMLRYIEQVLVPYTKKMKAELKLPRRQKALVICDVFRAHRCDEVIDALKAAKIEHVYVPAGCTGELQPMDLSVNGDFKTGLKNEFTEWYADEIANGNSNATKVDLRISILKPLHARWFAKVFYNNKAKRNTILLGWTKSGILDAVPSAQ